MFLLALSSRPRVLYYMAVHEARRTAIGVATPRFRRSGKMLALRWDCRRGEAAELSGLSLPDGRSGACRAVGSPSIGTAGASERANVCVALVAQSTGVQRILPRVSCLMSCSGLIPSLLIDAAVRGTSVGHAGCVE